MYAAHVLYRERDDGTEQWGEFAFSELDAEFIPLRTARSRSRERPRIVGEVSGLMRYGAGAVSLWPMPDGSQRFTIHATLAEMPVTVLNGMTRPLMRMQMQSGSLEYLEMDLEGDDRKAKGSMAIRRRASCSPACSGMETMLKGNLWRRTLGGPAAKFNIARDPEKAFTGYLWHATREGLARNLVPEVWGRVRDMLRSDAEERRELRARRRARQKGP
ncbi:MAG: hypothetical protein IPJ10_16345 [Flavobacteriales bacterium]|nr:hypothetical protein [Flavobacteriales bacterium]